MNNYILSQEADNDLENIFDFTNAKFDLNQAFIYLSDIEELFCKLVLNPEIGRVRNELKQGLYSFPIREHTIFYRIMSDHIRIVRIIYGARDIPRFFE